MNIKCGKLGGYVKPIIGDEYFERYYCGKVECWKCLGRGRHFTKMIHKKDEILIDEKDVSNSFLKQLDL